ncbi:TBC-domain-containing protein [Pseudohyphozyma bogoriensis]|nr:TBC-domain-containing protein [Pseudohyphozyma bogoriensis]
MDVPYLGQGLLCLGLELDFLERRRDLPTQTIRGPPVAVPAPTPVVATPVGGGGAATSSVSSGWGGGSISGVSSAVGASTSSRVPAAAKSEVAPSVASSTAVASGSGLSQSGRLNLDEIATTLKEVELETQAQQPLTKANLDVAHAFKSKLVSVTGVLENSLGSSEFKPTRSAAVSFFVNLLLSSARK